MSNPIKHTISLVLLILFASVMGSCVKESREPSSETSRVLFAYIGVDNNLAGYHTDKLEGLRIGHTGKAADHILAYVDITGAGAALYELSNLQPGETMRKVASYGSENSASPATLSRVIDEITTTYKADSYGMLVFSHATGWLPGMSFYDPDSANNTAMAGKSITTGGADVPRHSGSTDTRSIIIDGARSMELADFAAAIPDGVFDYIAFETCFMAGIEVAYELRHKAPYILASSAEIVDPGFAPVYASSTAKLLGGNIAGFGQDAFGHVLTYADTNPQRSATLSVIKTAALDKLAVFIASKCDFARPVDIAEVQHFDRNDYRLFFDMGDYYSRLLATDSERAELARLLKDCVVWKAATDEFMTQGATDHNGFAIHSHSGLTAYIPQSSFAGLNAAYMNLTWFKALSANETVKLLIDGNAASGDE